MMSIRVAVSMLFVALTAACSAVEVGAPPEQIAAASHVSSEPPYVSVVSMVHRQQESAAHTALFINASQRVIYDPAGTFQHRNMPERGDIHYGATDRMIDYYERYHARFSHYVHVQKIPVSAATAEAVLRIAQARGPSPKMFCTVDTVAVLNAVPEIPRFSSSFFPEHLRRQVARLPSVQNRYRYEEDRGKTVPVN